MWDVGNGKVAENIPPAGVHYPFFISIVHPPRPQKKSGRQNAFTGLNSPLGTESW